MSATQRADLAYWVTTGLFCAALAGSGVAHLSRIETIAVAMQGLGYPAYVMTILGSAKLLGAATLLAPGVPLLKEWAYAGFTFNLLGGAASHAFAGDPVAEILPPLFLLCVGLASYRLRPASRSVAAPPRPATHPA